VKGDQQQAVQAAAQAVQAAAQSTQHWSVLPVMAVAQAVQAAAQALQQSLSQFPRTQATRWE
jgi:hypothetical protein